MTATNNLNAPPNATSPAFDLVAITPSDSTNVTGGFRAIYVGAAGNIAVVTYGGNTVTLVGALAGSILPVFGVRINATNTTATSLVALQ